MYYATDFNFAVKCVPNIALYTFHSKDKACYIIHWKYGIGKSESVISTGPPFLVGNEYTIGRKNWMRDPRKV